MQWSIFITTVRRDRLGSSQTRGKVQFKLPETVLKLAKARAGAIKNPARDFVVLLVLGRLARACQVGSIATPPNRTAKAKHFCGDLQPIQLQIPGGIPEFFWQIVSLFSGQGCPTLVANCLADLATCWGSPRWHGLLGFVIKQLRNHKQL